MNILVPIHVKVDWVGEAKFVVCQWTWASRADEKSVLEFGLTDQTNPNNKTNPTRVRLTLFDCIRRVRWTGTTRHGEAYFNQNWLTR